MVASVVRVGALGLLLATATGPVAAQVVPNADQIVPDAAQTVPDAAPVVPAAGQTVPVAAPGTVGVHTQALDLQGFSAVDVSVRPRATVTVGVLRLAAGSILDPRGLEGTAALFAETVRRSVKPASRAFRLTAHTDRAEMRFTLSAPPEVFPGAWNALVDAVFDAPVTVQAAEEARAATLSTLAFQAGSPVGEFEALLAEALSRGDSEWARPVTGDASTVGRLMVEDLEAFRRTAVSRGGAAAALVTGPGFVAAYPELRPPAGGPPLHTTPDAAMDQTVAVTFVERDITNAWVAVAWPVTGTASRSAMDFLAHLLEETLDPDPPESDRFLVRVTVDRVPSGLALIVRAAVLPESAERWRGRIVEALEEFRAREMNPDFLGWRRRRFRTALLLRAAEPELDALRRAQDLATLGRVRDLSTEVWGLDGPSLLGAARALGPPTILIMGPDLSRPDLDGPRG